MLRAFTTADRRPPRRTGVALLAFVCGVLVLGLMVLWLTQQVGTASLGYLGHYISSGALYAAESGEELALRELSSGTDHDGDGTAGTISNDGNDGNNPTLINGSFKVTVSGKKYSATGTWQNHRRIAEVTIE